jgi:hypothetical protein
MKLPPRWIRRLLLAPAIFLIGLVAVVTLPITVPIAAFATRFLPGRLRVLGLVWLALV